MANPTIQPTNFQFARVNPNFNGIISGYNDYINEVIAKDKENKTKFELLQHGIDNLPIGNGGAKDKEAFKKISKKFGEKINSIGNNWSKDQGFAGLSNVLHDLKREVVNDSGIKSLQQSEYHKNTIMQKLGGENVTDPTTGKVSKVKDKNVEAWGEQYADIHAQQVINNSGVVEQQDGSYTFQGGNFDLPEYIDFNEYRKKYANEANLVNKSSQRYAQDKYGRIIPTVSGTGVQGQVQSGKIVTHYANVDGANAAMELAMMNDPKVQAFINKKIELDNYARNGKVDFNIDKIKESIIN